ncbi:MAG TPA: hypothetical protein VGB17_10610 [Pyrinomonadaceae bacterium]|jgi:hypothetical protein
MQSKPKHIVSAIEENKGLLLAAGKNQDADAVGSIIDNILQIRNVVPGTAEIRKNGSGHGECGNSGILEVLETGLRTGDWKSSWGTEDEAAEQALASIWRLFDYDPASLSEDVAVKVLTHFISIRMSYPKTFEWLSSKKSWWLMPFLKNNRKLQGMPLGRLSNQELDDIWDYVLPKL